MIYFLDPKEKSSFPYWFKHWLAFQKTAKSLNAWKFKYIFHDIEKPFLRVFLHYKRVQYLHRRYSKHHPECIFKKDYEQMIIDWECSRFTKPQCKYNAYDHMKREEPNLESEIMPILRKLKLIE